eukprot:762494-Hanusia_phi.AAC.2
MLYPLTRLPQHDETSAAPSSTSRGMQRPVCIGEAPSAAFVLSDSRMKQGGCVRRAGRLTLRGGCDGNAGVKKNFSNERLDDAKSRLKKILGANSQLERQVADLAASYDKLAKSYGLGSFKPTRTASYSCLNDVTLTEAADKEVEEEAAKPPPVESIQQKIDAALAKDSKPVEATEEVLPPEERLNVVIVSSEVAPFSKSGGLADVCDKLGVSSRCRPIVLRLF